MDGPVLMVRNLTVKTDTAVLVEGIDVVLERGRVVGVIGESGCGKTVTSMAILQLLDKKTCVTGEVWLQDINVTSLEESAMRKRRGKDIGFIMQNPMSAFTPVYSIGHQFIETIREHLPVSKQQATRMAIEALEEVHLPNPQRVMKSYPFELSGGMLQRVMIAFAVCLKPKVLIADEPTTALDVMNQKQVLYYLERLRVTHGTAILLISHDLGVIAEMADDVIVMKDGRIVEQGDVFELFDAPQHAYTKQLMRHRFVSPETQKIVLV